MIRTTFGLCLLAVLIGAQPVSAQMNWWAGPQTGSSLTQWWSAPPSTPPSAGYPAASVGPLDFAPVNENYNVCITTDAIILGRTGLDPQVIAQDGGGNTVLDPGDIDLGAARIGPRISIFVGGRQTGLEFSCFGINDLSFDAVANQPGITPIFYGAIPANPVSSYNVNFRGRLNSAEVMFWKPVLACARWGIGIRGVGLNETYDVLQSEDTSIGFFSNTGTKLVGLQLGFGVPLWRRPFFHIDATAKSGVYNQKRDLDAISQNFELHYDDNDTTAVTELNVGGEYHFGRHVSLRGGYLVLWLHDVAPGLNQNDSFDIVAGTGAFDLTTVVYQGGYFGVQARW